MQIRFGQVLLSCSLLAIMAACAGRPEHVLLPISEKIPSTSKVDLLVATTRKTDASGEMFSGERGRALSFANVVVSIPPGEAHKSGDVEWPQKTPGNPATDFVTVKAERLDLEGARQWVRSDTALTPKRRVLVFVHGFNNRFDDAVFRSAQFVHDAGTPLVPVLFTWPSRGSIFAYGYDRESTNFSRDGLEQVLNLLAKDENVAEITILAHSMGNWLTLETLRQMAIRDHQLPLKIKDVMLAAPDVDVDVFANEIDDMGSPRPKFTLLVSRDDRALALSRRLWGSTARLGAIDPTAEPYKTQLAAHDITVIDLTKHGSNDSLNHGKFATSPELVRLIGGRLEEGQTIDDWNEGVGDRIFRKSTDIGMSVGGIIGLGIALPESVVDQTTRQHLPSEADELSGILKDTVTNR
ncbi:MULTISPECIES: alpha/beta hydrolase [unclassified Rhizobium]|uniref:alpha/beta hydrolase n=1 Tax=unclassified Rhizobium TaxID=2613769 RepID=UPI001A981784|nr:MULTISPECIES: alpha/beta hydrolase [unclassified Rhizobium]MBX5173579.1 alpha/beta hydrolase [Rhizobium sp. NZLR1b]MBX5205996.1 alpha/beta hydrolase [Rhizobium sp. NZLR1]MBX5212586.1 alpha/beta hydrolase [Rhizobium sp. NZLR11]QSZ25236.1 alpha/beta hydrolase [Rhizobium sp. NZLR1]